MPTKIAVKKVARPRPGLRKSTINLLLRIKKEILTHPETYNQHVYCGSGFCFAGHAVALKDPKLWKKALNLLQGSPRDRDKANDLVLTAAHQSLKLPTETSRYYLLGTEYSWPHRFLLRYERAKYAKPKALARVGASVIDNYIKTDGWASKEKG